jgi:hypothetical protein
VHIGFEGEGLDIFVFTDFDELLSAFVAGIPEVLKYAEHPKYTAVLFHETLSGER